jgi:release factor glutamine methyltransferase
VLEGDLDEPLPAELAGRVDVLVANVPYVPTAEIDLLPAEARLHEPRFTLDGGEDGLRVFARVAELAPRWLAAGGSVLCETSDRQAAVATAILTERGLAPRTVVDEDLGASVVVGSL